MKKLFFFTLLTFNLKSEVLIPAEHSSLKEFENFIKSTEYISYTEFKIQEMRSSEDLSEKILNSADTWLNKDSSFLQINKDLRQLQNEKFFKGNERRILFNILEKKMQQPHNEEGQKYFISQACWIYANDKEIKSEFSQFEDYCQLKKISTYEIRKKFPDYKYLITDGSVIPLKSDTSLFYNEVPQKIELLSDKKQTVSFYGPIESFMKKTPASGDFIVKGNSNKYENKDIDNMDFYQIYFSDKQIIPSIKKSFLTKSVEYISENKYEIISGTLIVLAGVYYMRDKTIKFENTNSLSLKTSFSY